MATFTRYETQSVRNWVVDVSPPNRTCALLFTERTKLQCFARKLLHLQNPKNKLTYIENEARAVRKLCDGRNPNVIHVFGMGDFTYSSYYFIDMELCDLSLQGYLYPDPTEYTAIGLPPLLRDLPSASVPDHIWNIMRQIASGLKFIHAHSEAHRDLKPSNGDHSYCIVLI